MVHYPFHLLNSPELSQYLAGSSNINHTITYENGVGPEYYQPQNRSDCVQSSYNEPQFQGGGSQGAIEEVLPLAESHSRRDADLGVPGNTRTKYAQYYITTYRTKAKSS